MKTLTEKLQEKQAEIENLKEQGQSVNTKLEEELRLKYDGQCKTKTVVDEYVKLFTVTFTEQYKLSNTLFFLSDTQSARFAFLVNLTIYRDSNEAGISTVLCTYIPFVGTLSNLFKVIVLDTNTAEIYYKMTKTQSPTMSIITSHNCTNTNGSVYSSIEIGDMTTSVAEENLPSGTQYDVGTKLI